MPRSYYKHGDWNAICDICGFKFKASQLRKNWRGLMVDDACWEPRNQQDFIKVRAEMGAAPWSRPQGDVTYLPVCYLWDNSGYANLAKAGCMVAGGNTYTAAFLTQQKNSGSIT